MAKLQYNSDPNRRRYSIAFSESSLAMPLAWCGWKPDSDGGFLKGKGQSWDLETHKVSYALVVASMLWRHIFPNIFSARFA